MKKTLSVILLLLVAVTCVFAGCGNPSGTKNSSGFSKFEKLYEAVIAEDYEAPTKLTIATSLQKGKKISSTAVYNYDNDEDFSGAEITYYHSDGKEYVNKLYNLVTEIEGKESVVAATMELYNAERLSPRATLYKSFKVLHEGDDCETVFADYDLDANQYIADLYKAIIDAKEERTATVKVTAGENENDFTIEATADEDDASCIITIVNGLVTEYTHNYKKGSYTYVSTKVFTWGSASVELPKNIETWMDCIYDFGDDYFYLHSCEEEGCNNSARQESLNTYKDVFVYSLDEAKVAEIEAHYEAMEAHLASVEAYDETKHGFVKGSALYDANKEFEHTYFDVYGDYLDYITGQYQIAYILYCVNDNEENTANNTFVDEFRTAMVADYYRLYKLIYDTQYREYFFSEEDGWTEEDIQIALEYSAQYADETIERIQNRITEIETEYRTILNPGASERVVELYTEFVSLKNQYAQIKGYDNYMEYAYKNEHDRAYTPEETNVMREHVKEHFAGAVSKMLDGYRSETSGTVTNKAQEYFNALSDRSIFSSEIALQAIGDYFKTMTSSAHGKEINYYNTANELFKNGNYFRGSSYEGAYGWYVGIANTGILYFGPGYDGAFTFVHEFGHYHNYCYNPSIDVSTDVAEIHSQGNEMIFLSYLDEWLPSSARSLYKALIYYNMYSAFANTLISTAVDEFEYVVYSGKYSDGTPYDSSVKSYDELFNEIIADYGLGDLGVSDYWRRVCIESPCYYIAYAMSMIPSLELYVTAENEGLEAAKEKYFKLYAFTESEELTARYEDGSVYVTAGFVDVLEYAGLSSTFEEDVYIRIAAQLLN